MTAREAPRVSEHEHHNRQFWDDDADGYQDVHGAQLARGRVWGAWAIPDSHVAALGDVRGLDVLELGCGAAQWSIALGDDPRRCIALDQSRGQLAHARGNVARAGAPVRLVCASGELVPARDAAFDLVFCDHGAVSFCEPDRIIPECARVLRPGGRLVFNHATLLKDLCYDRRSERQTNRLSADYHGAGMFEWGEGTIDFHRTYGAWIRLLRASGFVVEDLIELVPDKRATTTYPDFVPLDWARRWPAEEIWIARRTADT
jgi:SAM-dependent methyltransferase